MNIFIAKLNPSTDGDGLNQLFSSFGEVTSTKVIMDRETGRSKCFGFVEMPNDEEGQKAIDALNQSEFEGNTIVVKKSEPKEESPRNFRNNDRNNRPNDRNRSNNRFDNNRRDDDRRDNYRRDDDRRGDGQRRDNNRRDNYRRDGGDRRHREDSFDTSKW